MIPETENVFSLTNGSGYFFAEYLVDAVSEVYQFDYNGKLIRKVDLPGIGSSSGFYGEKNQKDYIFIF